MRNTPLNNRIYLKGLAVGCPMGSPLPDCPLNGLRSIPLERINAVIDGIDDETINRFFKVHADCFSERVDQQEHKRKPSPCGGPAYR